MKRHFALLTVALLMLNSALFAEITWKPGVDLGLGMFNQAEKDSSGTSFNKSFRTALTLGGLVDISLKDYLSIETGLALSLRGGKKTQAMGPETHKLTYLTIPVHAIVRKPSPLISPFVGIGVNLGILLGATAQTSTNGGFSYSESDVATEYKTLDFGLDFTGGAELNIKKFTPFIAATYYLGLLKINNNAQGIASLKNSGLEIKLGIKFSR
jgi:hypothetical protein